MPLEFSKLRPNMFNMSYAHPGDRKLKLLDMMTSKWPFPSSDEITILEIIGRDSNFKPLLKLSPEYGYVIKKKLEDLQKNEDDANKPIKVPEFRQEFEGPDNNNVPSMTYEKLKKITKRKDPEVLKRRFISRELAKRKKLGIRNIEFKIAYRYEDKLYGASFTLYRNGSMRMSGKYGDDIPDDIHSFLVEAYGVPANELKYNNLTGSFSINAKPDVRRLVRAAPKPPVKDKNIIQKTGKLKKSKERLMPRVVRGIAIIPLKNCVLRVSSTGRCQIELAKNFDVAFREARDFLTREVTGPFGALPAQTNSKTRAERYMQGGKAPEVLRRGTTCPADRCPVPYSFQGKCQKAGMYIKPNPQGQPCCYKIPRSIAYSRAKVANAYKKADVKIPDNVKKMFDLENRNNALSNTTYLSGKNFIKVFNDPTIDNAYIEDMNRLLNAWKSKRVSDNGLWTLRTRPGSKAKFEDPMALNVIITKARGRKLWHVPDVSQLKIGTRQCTRYTKVALMDIAKRLNIIEARPNMKKEVLCHLIRKATRGTSTNRSNTGSAGGIMAVTVSDTGKRGKVERAITGNGLAIRIGHRNAITFPLDKLRDFAKQLGAGAGRENLGRDALVGLIADLADAKRRSLKKNINIREKAAKEAAEKRAENNARRAKEIANKAAANRAKEVANRLKNLGLVNKKGRGQMNAVMPPSMYLNLAMNKNRRNAMRQNVINMAKEALKRERIKPINLEKTAKGGQKGVIKRFMKAFESDVEAKYRPIYYSMLVNGDANMANRVKNFANTIQAGKKSKPSFRQIKAFAEKLKNKAVKK